MNYIRNLVKMNLQKFSQADVQKTTTSSLSVEMKTFYEDTLLDHAEPKLVHDQFADKYNIPKNGGKIIEFRGYSPLDKATTEITEAVTPDGNTLNVYNLTATVKQYGDYIRLSDLLEMSAIDNNVVQATKVLGAQAGRTLDTITRDVIVAGTNVIYAPTWSGTTPTAVTSRASLDKTATLTPDLFFKAAAQLEANNADVIDDSFVAIIHPYSAYDLMRSSEWISIHQYAQPENIYNGEIGKIGNVRFVQTSEAKIWKDSTNGIDTDQAPAYATTSTYNTGALCSKDSKVYKCKEDSVTGTWDATKWTEQTDGTGRFAVFGTMVLAAHAYATTQIEGGGLEHIVKQLGYGDDPLNQRASVGWKATKVAERLAEEYMIRIESCSSYSSTAQAN